MDKPYILVNDHLRTAELLLISRHDALLKRQDDGADVKMELRRVGSLLRSLRRASRDMSYWFDADSINLDPLPYNVEQDYYDEAGVPARDRYSKP